MDQKLNDSTEAKENNLLFVDLLSLDNSIDYCFDEKHMNDEDTNCFDHSEQMNDNQMQLKSTPKKFSSKTNLFGFSNKLNNNQIGNKTKPIVETNMSSDKKIITEKKKKKKKNENFDNSLGLSPVKKEFLNNRNNSYINQLSDDLDGIRMNSFLFSRNSTNKTSESQSDLMDDNFKSFSKCSDLDLKPNEQKTDLNESFYTPNSEFEKKSIRPYFKQSSKPISRIDLFGYRDQTKSDSIVESSRNETSLNCDNEISSISDAFVSVTDEISASGHTLLNAQKIIDRNSRKRKADTNNTFIPRIKSTKNSCEDNSNDVALKTSNVLTSGLGSSIKSLPHSEISSIGSSVGNALSLSQLLTISPTVISLTIGCFVTFKLNYLKIKNLSITSFKINFKFSANVDTLNDLQITVPSEAVSIPALFDGLLTNDITITPLKCGSFKFVLQIYPSIENVFLPISPLSVICQIKSEAVHIKRLLSSTDSSIITYNLFEECDNHQTIDLILSNNYFSNEIPLKLSLEPSKCLMFESLYRHPESAIHSFRCPDPHTLFLITKTQYEIRIPLKIQSFGEKNAVSSLTVAIDSVSNSHVLAVYRLSAKFWPKKSLSEPSLQCSESSISLTTGKWKKINFRNKSINSAIHVRLKCTRDKNLIQDVRFSSSEFIIPPLEKISISLMIENRVTVQKNSEYHISAEHSSGLGKSWLSLIPIF